MDAADAGINVTSIESDPYHEQGSIDEGEALDMVEKEDASLDPYCEQPDWCTQNMFTGCKLDKTAEDARLQATVPTMEVCARVIKSTVVETQNSASGFIIAEDFRNNEVMEVPAHLDVRVVTTTLDLPCDAAAGDTSGEALCCAGKAAFATLRASIAMVSGG